MIVNLFSKRQVKQDPKKEQKIRIYRRFKAMWLKVTSKVRIKKLSITEARMKQIQAIFTLVVMLVLFYCGYVVMNLFEHRLMLLLLGSNLIVIANVMLYKMK